MEKVATFSQTAFSSKRIIGLEPFDMRSYAPLSEISA
jgi:hypothetical protein